MKFVLRITAILLVGSITAHGQEVPQRGATESDDLQAVTDATTAYGRCVVSYARRYATSHELPADIVTAAFGACFQQRNALGTVLSRVNGKHGMPQPEETRKDISRAEADMQRTAIREILEARNPAIK